MFLMILLGIVAFLTLLERQILGLINERFGPNKVSFLGLLQPLVDALKLSNKNLNKVTMYLLFFYYMAPGFSLFLGILVWTSSNLKEDLVIWKFSILAMMLIMSMMTMKSLLAAWSTKTKYPLLGSMRGISQMISYEAVLFLCILIFVINLKGFSMKLIYDEEVKFFLFCAPVVFVLWTMTIHAELSRTPFDYMESESELVSGFNTEMGSSAFTLVFLSEYMNILFMNYLTVMIFLGSISTSSKVTMFLLLTILTIWARGTFPRLRFDVFMSIAWKFYIPFLSVLIIHHMLELS